MITPLIERLELPDFGHITISTIQFESRSKILLVTSWTEIMTSKPLFRNIEGLEQPISQTSSKLQL